MAEELPILKGILKGVVSYHNARRCHCFVGGRGVGWGGFSSHKEGNVFAHFPHSFKILNDITLIECSYSGKKSTRERIGGVFFVLLLLLPIFVQVCSLEPGLTREMSELM
uniref:Uncharacterized protein n=1 Tax=Anopheles culicifacies TaxID=139723 RepID=A0A182LZ65_9DIPT